MKKVFTIFFAIFCFTLVFSQNQNYRTFTWNNVERNYIEITPSDITTPKPVLFVLHGLGDSDTNMLSYLPSATNRPDWYYIVPQAIEWSLMTYNLGAAWNISASGNVNYSGFTIPYNINSNIDDEGFLIAILDSLINNHSVDQDSIFFIGFSLGGFMTNKMGILHGDRIKGIASINGTIGNELGTTVPVAKINALHIHGTADNVIDYNTGEATMSASISVPVASTGAEETVEFWRSHNNCDINSIDLIYEDLVNDGFTFERNLYINGDNNSKTAFIKANGGLHNIYYVPNNDIDYFAEIIKFFRNQWEVNEEVNYNISGTVTENGNPLVNVTINYNHGTQLTNAQGQFSITVPENETITITPILNDYIFTPTDTTITASSDIPDINFIAQTISAHEINSINFAIFPNPAANNINISINQINVDMEIYNIIGEKILETKLTNFENSIDISSLKKGAYIIKVNNTVKNIIVQ